MSLTPPGPPVPPLVLPGATPEPPPRRSAVLVRIAVGVMIFALVAAGVGGWLVVAHLGDDDARSTPSRLQPSARPTEQMPATPAALAAFYDQELTWTDCGRNECSKLRVPLDYAEPTGTTIELAVLKAPARNAEDRLGSLVVNPGGPGASGVRLAAGGANQFGSELVEHYDIVGFDPRGVGSSQPLECLSTAGLDEFLAFDPDPDTPAEVSRLDDLLRGFGQGCLDKSGDLARHISTREAARDMDILRAALGEQKLDYLGYSYGTLLGATYAEQFSANVGRFVLDGAIDPSLSNAELSLQQGEGFETALRAYLKDCVSRGCFLGGTVDQGARKIRSFLDELDARPIPGKDGRPLTEGLGMYGIWLPLYVEALWPTLTGALEDAIVRRDGSSLMGLADTYASRGAGEYEDNSIEALYAVNCLDHSDSIPSKDVAPRIAEFEKVSPTFGAAFAYGLSSCASWPIKSGERTVALHARGAAPIVVIGTTRDPATPLVWAQALAKQLDSGRLITRDGDGHTGFQQGNACVDDAVEGYLVQGTVPPDDLKC